GASASARPPAFRARNAWSSPVSILQDAWNSATMTGMETMHPTTEPVRRRRSLALALPMILAVGLLAVAWTGSARAQIGPLEDLDKFPSADLTISDGKKVK